MDDPDVSQLPSDAVNAPASGTYGETAALDRLKAQLPGAATPQPGSGPGPTQPMPTPPMSGGMSTPPSGALPASLMAPTTQPGTPLTTPLAMPPQNPMLSAQSQRQRNLAKLDALMADPNTSDETKEWARNLVSHLISMSTAR